MANRIAQQMARARVLAIREKMLDLQALIESSTEDTILNVDRALVDQFEEACTELGMSLTLGLPEEDQQWISERI